MQGKKNIGTAIALIILLGPFGFIYLGWKNFLLVITGMIIIGLISPSLTGPVIFSYGIIFEIILLTIIWSRYRKREKFFELVESPEEIQGQVSKYKNCPFCGEQILGIASKCKHCGEFLNPKAVNFTKRRSSYRGLIAFVILIIIVLLGYMSRYTISFYTGTILEFNGGELSYVDPVARSEANDLGEFLVQHGWFDGQSATVLLTKTNNTYEVRMVTKKVSLENYSQDFLSWGSKYQQLYSMENL